MSCVFHILRSLGLTLKAAAAWWLFCSCCSVCQSCLTLFDPMDCSVPGFPVCHYLLEFAQTHVHWVRDAIQPSYSVTPVSFCPQSFPASGSFLMSWLSASGGQSIGALASASVLPTSIQGWFPWKPGLTGFQFSSAQLLSCVPLFVTPWIAAHQACLSINNSLSLLKLMSIEPVMLSNLLILCRPPLLLPSIFPSIRVFSNVSVLCIRWPKYWSFSFSISPSNEYSALISFRMDWLDLLAVQGTLKSLLQHHSSKASILQHSAFFGAQLSHPCKTTGWLVYLLLDRGYSSPSWVPWGLTSSSWRAAISDDCDILISRYMDGNIPLLTRGRASPPPWPAPACSTETGPPGCTGVLFWGSPEGNCGPCGWGPEWTWGGPLAP